jgi:hypothetical protein
MIGYEPQQNSAMLAHRGAAIPPSRKSLATGLNFNRCRAKLPPYSSNSIAMFLNWGFAPSM